VKNQTIVQKEMMRTLNSRTPQRLMKFGKNSNQQVNKHLTLLINITNMLQLDCNLRLTGARSRKWTEQTQNLSVNFIFTSNTLNQRPLKIKRALQTRKIVRSISLTSSISAKVCLRSCRLYFKRPTSSLWLRFFLVFEPSFQLLPTSILKRTPQ